MMAAIYSNLILVRPSQFAVIWHCVSGVVNRHLLMRAAHGFSVHFDPVGMWIYSRKTFIIPPAISHLGNGEALMTTQALGFWFAVISKPRNVPFHSKSL